MDGMTRAVVSRATAVVACAALLYCGGEEPPEPPPTTTSSISSTTTAPPSTGRSPEDYITRARAGRCSTDPYSTDNTDLCLELFKEIQESASRGWRDFLVLIEHCPWALEPNPGALFPIDYSEAEATASVGAALDREGWGFMQRLGEPNRRCDPDDPEHDPAFGPWPPEEGEGRTNVRKDRFSNPGGTGYRDRLREHLRYASELRSYLNGQPGEGVRWDSIAGWCQRQP